MKRRLVEAVNNLVAAAEVDERDAFLAPLLRAVRALLGVRLMWQKRKVLAWLDRNEKHLAPQAPPMVEHLKGRHDQKTHGHRGVTAANIIGMTMQNGGATVNPRQGNALSTGFIVAHRYPSTIVPTDEFKKDGTRILADFAKRNKGRFANGENYLGTWEHEGKVFLDVVQRVKSKDRAVRLGKERNQIAVYDLTHGKEIPTGGTGDVAVEADTGGAAATRGRDGRGNRSVGEGHVRVPDVADDGRLTEYNPYHDRLGRFAPKGGGGAAVGVIPNHGGRRHCLSGTGSAKHPLVFDDTEGGVRGALGAIGEGKFVRFHNSQEAELAFEKVATLQKLHPNTNYNLCKAYVRKSLICGESSLHGRLRSAMPQTSGYAPKGSRAYAEGKDSSAEYGFAELSGGGKPLVYKPKGNGFLDPHSGKVISKAECEKRGLAKSVDIGDNLEGWLASKGIGAKVEMRDASRLTASQNEVNGAKVIQLRKKLESNPADAGRVVISRDGVILDGHHRSIAEGLERFEKNGNRHPKVKALVIDMDIGEALPTLDQFTVEFGMPNASVKANQVSEAALAEYNPWHDRFGKFATAGALGGAFTPATADAEHATQPHVLPSQEWTHSFDDGSQSIVGHYVTTSVHAVKGAPFLMSDDTASPAVVGAYHRWSKGLTKDERGALESYTGSGFAHINSGLRDGRITNKDIASMKGKPYQFYKHLPTTHEQDLNTARTIGLIDSALDKAPSMPAMTLYRGMGESMHAKHGKPFTFKGFTSCSVTPMYTPQTEAMMRIKVPAGRHGMWLGDGGSGREKNGVGNDIPALRKGAIGSQGEGEFLLKRGTKFKWGTDEYGDYLEVVN